MIRTLTFIVVFIVLFLAFLWLFIYLLNDARSKKKKLSRHPLVTVCVPAHNEEGTIERTLNSLRKLSYPKSRLEVIVVDDGSVDDTSGVTRRFIKKNDARFIRLLSQENKGKGAAVNLALAKAKGAYFGILDADSTASKNSLRNLITQFENEPESVGCIISAVKISNEKHFWARVQKLEYNVSILIRQLMSDIDTLQFTHGVLSVCRTSVLRRLGGLDEKILTEDFELAGKLRYNKYSVKSCPESITYTNVPVTFKTFWRQRVRWYRGYIQTMRRYYRMLGNKNYGLVGLFQAPLLVIAPIVILLAASLILFNLFYSFYYFIDRVVFVEDYFGLLLESAPTIREFLLTMHLDILLPMAFTALVGLLLALTTFRYTKSALPNPLIICFYLFLYPLLVMAQWLWAFGLEVTRVRRSW